MDLILSIKEKIKLISFFSFLPRGIFDYERDKREDEEGVRDYFVNFINCPECF